jgi:hypothetical protein
MNNWTLLMSTQTKPKTKPVKFTLAAFHNYVSDQHKPKPKQRGGRISDRLRNRRDGGQESVGDRRDNRNKYKDRLGGRPPTSSAQVAGSKPIVSKLQASDFPSLDAEATSSAVEIGCWGNGIKTIIEAKDLPDPAVLLRVQALEQREAQMRDRLTIEYYSDDSYDSYNDEYEREQRSCDYESDHCERYEDKVPVEGDDTNWDKEL